MRKIQIFGNMLLDRYRASLDEKGSNYLTRLTGAAERMSKLLQSLLEYSRIATHTKPFEHIELRQVVEDAVSDLEIVVKNSDARIRIGKLPVFDADPHQIRQLFQNLIENAIKYRKNTDPPLIDISAGLKGEYWQILVQDNGMGFDEKYAQKIFKPFQRLHDRNYEGTGMGLAICRKVVERHKGTISVRSSPGKGASFEIHLPVNQEQPMPGGV